MSQIFLPKADVKLIFGLEPSVLNSWDPDQG